MQLVSEETRLCDRTPHSEGHVPACWAFHSLIHSLYHEWMSPTLNWKLLESFLFMAHAAWTWQQQILLIRHCIWAASWAFLIYTSSYIKTTPRTVDRVFHCPANLFKAEANMGLTDCPSSEYKLLLEYEKLTCSWELLRTVDIWKIRTN